MFDFVSRYKRVIQLFLGLIAVTFMTWGIESYTRFTGGRDTVATVGSMEISQREFAEQLRAQQERIKRMFGSAIDSAALDSAEARRALLDSMIGQRLLLGELARAHMLMSQEAVIEMITQAPEFQENGQFSAALYSKYLAERNLTDQGNVAELQSQIPLQRLASVIAESAIPSRAVAGRLAALEAQQREVAEVRLNVQQFLPQVKVDDAKVKAHYEASSADYRTPERVRAEYVVLSAENLARQEPVAEADLRAAYQARAAEFRVEEQRRASHILLKSKEEGQKLLAEVKKSPGRFAELAKQHSQDPGSAAQGGDLGWFGRGMMIKPFEDAVFRLRQNDIELVESEFGVHVLRVTGIQPGKARSFEEVRKELATGLSRQRGAKRFAEAAETFSNTVYEQSDSLKPAAERFKLQVQASGWIDKSARQELGALDNPRLLTALFSADALKNRRNTDAIEVAPGMLVAARVLEHQPATQRKFEEVKDEIAQLLRQREASALAFKDGTARLEKLRKGEDAGVKWGPSRMVSRRSAQGLSGDLVRRVVAADVSRLPAYVGAPLPDAGYVLLRISRVVETKAGAEPQDEQRFAGLMGTAQLDAYVASLRERTSISVNAATLEKK